MLFPLYNHIRHTRQVQKNMVLHLLQSLFDFHLGMGPVEVLPVKDLVQLRKDQGFWGAN